MLVGNKSDLEQKRMVPLEHGLEKKKQHGCFMHIETSSHADVQSINFLFESIAKKIV